MQTSEGAPAQGLGVDIGGSGIKAAPVDLATGELVGERIRLATPKPSVPSAVADVVAGVVSHFDWAGPIGCTLPAVITGGVARTAANIDASWVGTDVKSLFEKATGVPVTPVNDADAAGLAEVAFGAARGNEGVVIVATLGTGIGTAVIYKGMLLPNTELGHIEVDGHDAETRASAAVRDEGHLSWEKWAGRLQRYFEAMENYFWPDLFVVGGGVSRRSDRFLPLLHLRTPIVPAQLRNDAGIAGAAIFDSATRARSGLPAGVRDIG